MRCQLRLPIFFFGWMVAASVGCGGRYRGPVNIVPTGAAVAIPRGAYIAVEGEVSSGGSPAPIVLNALTIRCQNLNVCSTDVAVGPRGAEGRVAGIAVGETSVLVQFVHPVTGEPGEHRFTVRIVDGATSELVPGIPAVRPMSDGRLLVLPWKDSRLSCSAYASDLGYAWESIRGGAVDRMACEPAIPVGSAGAVLFFAGGAQRWNHRPDGVEVCVVYDPPRIIDNPNNVPDPARVKTVHVVERTGRSVRFLERRGPETPGRCVKSTRENDL